MDRRTLILLAATACVRPHAPVKVDLEVAGPCKNPYFPVALGNHWEYDLASRHGAPIGQLTLDVVSVSAQSAKLRSVESHEGKAGAPVFFTLSCVDGAIPPQAQVEEKGARWSGKRYRQTSGPKGPMRAELATEGRRAADSTVRVPAGEYHAVEIDHNLQLALSSGVSAQAAAQTFVAANVGIVRAAGGNRVVSLRSFRPRLAVTGPMPPPPPAHALAARGPGGCSCEPCGDVAGGNKNCKQCDWCECYPKACDCPGQPSCNVLPPCGPGCARAGVPGMRLQACPHHARFIAGVITEDLCYELYWDTGIGAILSGLGVLDAGDVCRRSWFAGDEWELLGEGEVVGTVGGIPANECNPDPTIQACPPAPCDAVVRSGEDLCYTHYDRDFDFDLVLSQNSGDLRWLNVLNMIGTSHLVGRDLEVEWEYSYMFPPHHDTPGNEQSPTVDTVLDGRPVSLRVPWPRDSVAVHGAVISDCGHACGDPLRSRSEIHPPTAVAWVHALEGKPGHYQLSWRMSSHATFPRDDPKQIHGTLHATLPLPDGLTGSVILDGPTTCDYLYTDWDVDVLDGCKLAVSDAPYDCRITSLIGYLGLGLADYYALLAALDSEGAKKAEIVECRGQPNARLEHNGGSCADWQSYFRAQITPGQNGVTVAIDSTADAPEDRPNLFGGSVLLCVPTPGGGSCPTCRPACDGTTCGGADGCGGTCGCAPHSHCRNHRCLNDCASNQRACPDGTCIPQNARCP